ncbi:MAG: DivIVA domain-containing protein [Oscillospiraceae bacterium]|nr:DivIVA domain-containing protein [Oscillospiraceae bacterium]
MLTPQEVQDKRFKAKPFGGYDMPDVDNFLEVLSEDYSALFKENAILKSKMRVLVDKLEEYRKVDDSMRQTLLNAQKMAEQIISDAQIKSDQMTSEMSSLAETRKEEVSLLLQQEESRLEQAKNQTMAFVGNLREIYQRQMDQLSMIPVSDISANSKQQVREQATRSAAVEIEKSILEQHEEPGTSAVAKAVGVKGSTEKDLNGLDKTLVIPDMAKAVQDALEAQQRITSVRQPSGISVQPHKPAEPVQTYEVTFGDPDMDEDEIKHMWDPEHDTEVPRPKYDFSKIDQLSPKERQKH